MVGVKNLLPHWEQLWKNLGIRYQGDDQDSMLANDFDLSRSHDVSKVVLESVVVPEYVYVEPMAAPVHRLVNQLHSSRSVALVAERVELLSAESASGTTDEELLSALVAKVDDFLCALDRTHDDRVIELACFCPYWPPMLRKDGSWFMRCATYVWEHLVWAPGAYVKGLVVDSALDTSESNKHRVTATFVFDTTDEKAIRKLEQSLYGKRSVRLEIE
jgi:hypothetical protein